MNKIKSELIHHCLLRIEENTNKISTCLDEILSDEIWKRPNNSSNSIGNQILHLCGNIRQYAISSLGGQPDIRERDKEFEANEGYSKEELLKMLNATVEKAIEIIKSINEEDLIRIRSVQGFEMSGVGILIHVTEHYSYHTGQIIFWTKLLKNKSFNFYEGTDLNKKNIPDSK